MYAPSIQEPQKSLVSQTTWRLNARNLAATHRAIKMVLRPQTWYSRFALNTSVVLCGPSS
jgi:hypothetical protein